MPGNDYEEALIAAKLAALRKLKELLSTTEDRAERRRIAQAILSTKPIPLPAAPRPPARAIQPLPAPAAPATNSLPFITRHALGTLNLDTQSLPIQTGVAHSRPTDNPREDAMGGSLPITLTPSDEPLHVGGPAGPRPLPLPLGPPRA